MTDCRNAEMRDRLPDFVHGQLSAGEHAEVSAHAAACAACAAELALLRELRAALRAAPAVDVAKIVSAVRAAAVRAARPSSHLDRPAWRRFEWRIAAVVAVLFAAGGSALVLNRVVGDERAGARRSQSADAGRNPTTADARVQHVAANLSLDADLGDATAAELEELLEDLESFDGLPAREPEPAPSTPGDGAAER
ncbi:MAG: zf-HC2 domain-containing protein [Gemmatimonadaceae bacterium]